MFQDISTVFRDDLPKLLGACFRSWVAVDSETGAVLSVSNGRARSGTGRNYFLTLHGESFADRNFDYFAPFDIGMATYSRLKAHTDAEAIAKANARLQKMLSKKEIK